MELTFLAAFLGGALALLSPCGALLLPAFFASTVGAGPRLLLHGGIFLLGLSVTLVPLGLGASAVGSTLTQHRELLVTVAGVVVILLGVLQLLGRGTDLTRLVPGVGRLTAYAHARSAVPRTFLLGTVSGVAGFCAGPVLGAVLTLAAAEGSPLVGGAMLAVYGAGMVLPLVLIAWTWTRTGPRGRALLRGREVRLGPLRVHSTSAVTGALLIVVGVVFLASNGMLGLPEVVPAATQARLQETALGLGATVPDVLAVLVGLALALAGWLGVRRRSLRGADTHQDLGERTPHGPEPEAPSPESSRDQAAP